MKRLKITVKGLQKGSGQVTMIFLLCRSSDENTEIVLGFDHTSKFEVQTVLLSRKWSLFCLKLNLGVQVINIKRRKGIKDQFVNDQIKACDSQKPLVTIFLLSECQNESKNMK